MDIIYKYTSEINERDKNNWYSVLKGDSSLSKEWFYNLFSCKFEKNIYGDSLHLFAYDNEKCVGIQTFQRNDVDDIISFQSCDSVVDQGYKRRGIFSKMVSIGTDILPRESLIYGFPNNNSLPAFLKLGWEVRYREKYVFFSDINKIPEMEKDYFNWLVQSNPELFFQKKSGYYLVLKRKKYNLFVVFGKIKIDKSQDILLPRLPLFPMKINYDRNGKIGNGMVLITKGHTYDNVDIPNYKMDTLIY